MLKAATGHWFCGRMHRRLNPHGINRLSKIEGGKPIRVAFRGHSIGYLHIDIALLSRR